MARGADHRGRKRDGEGSLAIAFLGLVLAVGPPARASQDCEPARVRLALPAGLCAAVVARETGPVRHLAVAPDGSLAAAVRGKKGVLLLGDDDGDGRTDPIRRFGPAQGQSVAFSRTHLYLSTPERIVRWAWRPGQLQPKGPAETIVRGFVRQREHAAKAITLGANGSLFVSVGAPYREGAFVAFHGSWNRAPLPQQGFRVAFVPFADGSPTGTFSTFAEASPGADAIRPSGLALDASGALYIADDAHARIWKVWKGASGSIAPNPESGGRRSPDSGRAAASGRQS